MYMYICIRGDISYQKQPLTLSTHVPDSYGTCLFFILKMRLTKCRGKHDAYICTCAPSEFVTCPLVYVQDTKSLKVSVLRFGFLWFVSPIAALC